MDIIEALNWRYAAKRMTGEVVPPETIEKIITAMHLSPSGIGLQPYKVIVISDPELKEKIKPVAYNQAPVTESSHLLVFAPWDTYSEERINGVFEHLNKERHQPANGSDSQRKFALSFFGAMTEEEHFHHAAKQAHIALGLAVATAALEQIDATPMEGFDPAALDALLGLRAKGLRSSMLMALGYRDIANDWNYKLKKVRKPLSSFVTRIGQQSSVEAV